MRQLALDIYLFFFQIDDTPLILMEFKIVNKIINMSGIIKLSLEIINYTKCIRCQKILIFHNLFYTVTFVQVL